MNKKKKAPAAQKIELLKQSENLIVLAEDAYDTAGTRGPAGWTIRASADPPAPGEHGFFAKIYEREGAVPAGAAQYAVAFRGTDSLRDIKDIESDADIALRKIPKAQYDQGLAFVQRFCRTQRINPAAMVFTGHSLGGYLAIAIGETLGAKRIWTFNSPGPTERMRDKFIHKIPGVSAAPGQGLVQIRSIYDLISEWGFKEGITIGVKTAGSAHALKSLWASVTATIQGKLPVDPVRKVFLSGIFNAIASKLALSRHVHKEIARLFDNAPRKKGRDKHAPGRS